MSFLCVCVSVVQMILYNSMHACKVLDNVQMSTVYMQAHRTGSCV